MATIKIQKLHPYAIIPKYETQGASGFDLCSMQNLIIPAGKWALIPTGLAFSIKKKYEIQIRPRSGLALKHGITILNSPGTIDSDYRGEVKIIAINLGNEDFEIKAGDRIAQAVLCKTTIAHFKLVSKLDKTERLDRGFGSTGR